MSELLDAKAGEWDDLHALATRVEDLLPEGDES